MVLPIASFSLWLFVSQLMFEMCHSTIIDGATFEQTPNKNYPLGSISVEYTESSAKLTDCLTTCKLDVKCRLINALCHDNGTITCHYVYNDTETRNVTLADTQGGSILHKKNNETSQNDDSDLMNCTVMKIYEYCNSRPNATMVNHKCILEESVTSKTFNKYQAENCPQFAAEAGLPSHGRLATFQTEDEFQQFWLSLGQFQSGGLHHWIGGRRIAGIAVKRELSKMRWMANTRDILHCPIELAQFSNSISLVIDGLSGEADCLWYHADSKTLNDRDCNMPRNDLGAFCEILPHPLPPVGDDAECQGRPFSIQLDNTCYFHSDNDTANYDDARERCIDAGGALATYTDSCLGDLLRAFADGSTTNRSASMQEWWLGYAANLTSLALDGEGYLQSLYGVRQNTTLEGRSHAYTMKNGSKNVRSTEKGSARQFFCMKRSCEAVECGTNGVCIKVDEHEYCYCRRGYCGAKCGKSCALLKSVAPKRKWLTVGMYGKGDSGVRYLPAKEVVEQVTIQHCATKCFSDEYCHGFNFRKSDGRCELTSSLTEAVLNDSQYQYIQLTTGV